MKYYFSFGILIASFFLLSSVSPRVYAAVNTTESVQTSSCTVLKNDLKYRSNDRQTGSEVSKLQNFLISKGYLTVQANGFFGVKTLLAVMSFQKNNSIQANPVGYVGSATRNKIQEISCENASIPAPSPIPSLVAATTTPTNTSNTSNNTNTSQLPTAQSQSYITFISPPKNQSTIATLTSPANYLGSFSTNLPVGTSYKIFLIPNDSSKTALEIGKGSIVSGNTQSFSTSVPSGVSGSYYIQVVQTSNCSTDCAQDKVPLSISIDTSPRINPLSSSSVAPGNVVTVYGANFDSNTRLSIDGWKSGLLVIPQIVNSTTLTFTTPMDIITGTYSLRVYKNAAWGGNSTPLIINSSGVSVAPHTISVRIADTYTNYKPGNDIGFYVNANYSAGTLKSYLYSTSGALISSQQISGLNNDKSTTLTIPLNTTLGLYQIKVCDTNSATSPICGTSENVAIGTSNTFNTLPVLTTQHSIAVTVDPADAYKAGDYPRFTYNPNYSAGSLVAYLYNASGVAITTKPLSSNGGAGDSGIATDNAAAGTYKITVCDVTNNICGSSNNFSIITGDSTPPIVPSSSPSQCSSPSTQTPSMTTTSDGNPSVTITSPNGGETLCVGKNFHITWNSTNVDKVSIGYSYGTGSLNWITNNIPNTGYYDWSVNTSNTNNKGLMIYVLGYHTGVGSNGDYSDGLVNISN